MCLRHLRRVSADDATTFGWVNSIPAFLHILMSAMTRDALTFGLNYGRVLPSGDERMSYHIRNLSVRHSSHFDLETTANRNTGNPLSDRAEKSP